MNWYVMLVRSGSENLIARYVRQRKDILLYSPKLTRFVHDRRSQANFRVQIDPLLKGYMFVQMPSDGFWLLSQFSAVFGFLLAEGSPYPIPVEIIEFLKSREQAGEFDLTNKYNGGKVRSDLAPFPEWLVEGGSVRINEGPFRSFVAIVRQAVSFLDIRVGVQIFGRETELQLPLDDIRNMD